MQKGGYQILDLSGYDIMLDSSAEIEFDIFNKIESTYKVILISGLKIDGETIRDTFVSLNLENDKYTGSFNDYIITISRDNLMTIRSAGLPSIVSLDLSNYIIERSGYIEGYYSGLYSALTYGDNPKYITGVAVVEYESPQDVADFNRRQKYPLSVGACYSDEISADVELIAVGVFTVPLGPRDYVDCYIICKQDDGFKIYTA